MTNKKSYNVETNRKMLVMTCVPSGAMLVCVLFVGFLCTNNDAINLILIAIVAAGVIYLYSSIFALMYIIQRDMNNPHKFDKQK